jgi:hypothetical protein
VLLDIGFALHNGTEGFGIVAPLAGEGDRPSWGFLLAMGLIGGGPTFVGTALGAAPWGAGSSVGGRCASARSTPATGARSRPADALPTEQAALTGPLPGYPIPPIPPASTGPTGCSVGSQYSTPSRSHSPAVSSGRHQLTHLRRFHRHSNSPRNAARAVGVQRAGVVITWWSPR